MAIETQLEECRHGAMHSVDGERDGHRLWRCGRCGSLLIWPDTQRDPVVVPEDD